MTRASNQGEFPSMSEWTDDVETEEEPERRHDVKRAVLGGVAGVALLVGPIALANAVVPDDEHDDVKTEDQASGTSLIALQQQRHASDTDLARLNGGLSLRTTTTTAPPTTTTTVPPTTTTTAPPETTTTAPPATDPPPTVDPPPDNGGSLGDPYNYASWDALAECEAGGNWAINTGNGYYGGLQMDLQFQRQYAPALLRNKGTANRWSPVEQMWVAERAHRSGRGFTPWPNTARMCGLL
jgi:hypothetical protein